jgi:hypothetical protein
MHQVWTKYPAESGCGLLARLQKARLIKLFGDASEILYRRARLVGEPQIKHDRANNAFSMTPLYKVAKLATENDGNGFVRFTPTNLAATVICLNLEDKTQAREHCGGVVGLSRR